VDGAVVFEQAAGAAGVEGRVGLLEHEDEAVVGDARVR
jgi:hypothetical protein